MFWKKSGEQADKPEIKRRDLTEADQWLQVLEDSYHRPVLLFKHSTRCGFSGVMLSRFEKEWSSRPILEMDYYLLDILKYKSLSKQVAHELHVRHESPQLLFIRAGCAEGFASHLDILDLLHSLNQEPDKNHS